ncbi:MAG: hypothetical protein FWD61_19550 [Phycisphaerales bacterium]|nr:hypothetical protein [Phycisphaerales bacterium]
MAVAGLLEQPLRPLNRLLPLRIGSGIARTHDWSPRLLQLVQFLVKRFGISSSDSLAKVGKPFLGREDLVPKPDMP